jgi:hypothetical protein
MRRALRENATSALLALAGCSAMAWLGLYGPGWNDYEVEVGPAFEALAHGQLGDFLRLAPVYGGSLVERAPFAALPGLWGGGALAIYRAVALPCLLAAALLGVWLLARMRAAGRPRLDRAVVLTLCVANPVTLTALEVGHPEELLGGCLCVMAVLLASSPSVSFRRTLLAGATVGLAIANKEWALIALGPVLLALPPGRRAICLGAAVATSAAVLAPLLLGSGGGFAAGTRAAATPGSTIFQPWQVFWFFGHHGALVHGAFGAVKPGYRIGPAWAATISHPLVLLAGAALAAVLWASTRGGRLTLQRALLALALILLARCLLDTWDALYYPLPFLLALLAWESGKPSTGPPLLTLMVSALVWFSFNWLPSHASADLQALCFLAWSLPLAGWLGTRLFASARPATLTPVPGPPLLAAQAITVSALGRPVSTSGPSARTTARSSIRTPSIPGR